MAEDVGGRIVTAAWVAGISVARPLAVCMLGYILGRFRLKAGGKETWRDVGRLNAELLTPCLVIASFTKGLDLDSLAKLWPVLVLGVALPPLWLLAGGFGAKLLLAKDQQHYVTFAATATAFQNGFAIPYPILLGLRKEVSFMEEGGDEYSATVAILFSFINLVYVWTVGFYLFGRAAVQERKLEVEAARKKIIDDAMAIEACQSQASISAAPSQDQDHTGATQERSVAISDVVDPLHMNASAADIKAETKKKEDVDGVVSSSTSTSPSELRKSKFTLCMRAKQGCASFWTVLSNVVNPLICSLILAVALALSPLRKYLVRSAAHDVLSFIGDASVPLALLQIGAGMVRAQSIGVPDGLRMKSAVVIAGLRLIVGNAVGAASIILFKHTGLINNPHLALVLFVECCSPAAANLILVSSVQQAYAQPVSVSLFIMQLASVVTMTISVAAFVVVLS